MYSGMTQWVNWELRQVLENERATSLILMFPEVKGWRSSRRRKNIEARVEKIREVFKDTPWKEELMESGDFTGLRAMLFRADGSMVMIKSRSRSRDSYHLAALIAHQQLLGGDKVSSNVDAREPASSARSTVFARGVTITAFVALLAATYLVTTHDKTRSHQEEAIPAKDAQPPFVHAEQYYGGQVFEKQTQHVVEAKTAFQSKAEASKNFDWSRELQGRALKYLKTGNGFSIQKTINVCNDGTRSQYTLSRRYVAEWDEWGTFVDDERWFNVRNKLCNLFLPDLLIC